MILLFYLFFKEGNINTDNHALQKVYVQSLRVILFSGKIQDMLELIFPFLQMFILHNDNMANDVRIAA